MRDKITFVDSGATFSDCRKYRYALWRIWNRELPLVMFIGLNPSTANETEPDPTIESVIRISKHNGYGGCYMMNLFAYVSTDPEQLTIIAADILNDSWLNQVRKSCKDVVFAWGAFVQATGRAIEVIKMFPDGKALIINKDGSPRHPLYMKEKTSLIKYSL